MEIDFKQLPPQECYRWLAGTVTPRPIAWVSTVSKDGITNLAPFSFFQVICDKPPTLMVNIASYEDGSLKDTLRNVQETGELVIHMVSREQSEIMNASSATFPHGISEFERCGIASEPAAVVRPPRVQKAVVAHECKLTQVIPYPAEKPRWHVIYAEVIRTHIDDRVLDKNGRIDILKLDVLGRLSGNMFCSTRELVELERPA